MISLLVKMICILLMHPESGQLTASSTIRYGDQSFSTSRLIETSPGLFSIMNFEVLALLSGENGGYQEGAILPVKTKNMLFGDSPALGKTIYVNSRPVQVTGLVRDVPGRSCLSCDLIIIRRENEKSVEALANIRCIIIQ